MPSQVDRNLGWNVFAAGSLSGTPVQAKAGPGTFGGYYVYNPNASAVFVQVFALPAAQVVPGTTPPVLSFGIPASGGANLEISNGAVMAGGMSFLASASYNGATGPATPVNAYFFYI